MPLGARGAGEGGGEFGGRLQFGMEIAAVAIDDLRAGDGERAQHRSCLEAACGAEAVGQFEGRLLPRGVVGALPGLCLGAVGTGPDSGGTREVLGH